MDGRSLNLGLHDQILQLNWVHYNIEDLRANVSQVTLFSVSLEDKLFHRTIIEPGAATSRAVHPPNASLHKDQFCRFVHVSGSGNIPDQEIFSCLRQRPLDEIINAFLAVIDRYNPSLRREFQSAIYGDLIAQRPDDVWNSCQWNKIPILTGFNINEGTTMCLNISKSEEFTAFFRTLLPAFWDENLKTIDSLYPPGTGSVFLCLETTIPLVRSISVSRPRTGGMHICAPVQLAKDEWSRREYGFWWTKTGLSD
ncbi:uncharacterized protein ATNIH1004_011753 [Aspergillus tanneri]|uniref:Carboxylesterase type B domain-containing protein n=1 Tax=Aspergillus tanneri TaxID=1220188 RepID=A0A5M9MF68_9EURO|nr:uncharacterized protein ATNIH1004_011753 [Aspergillus tanneri]KAA8641617.1 hypothetical protein ATNIH1004_011753 [Aspergillus tanneri]